MKFKKCDIVREKREWTPGRIGAAKRALKKERKDAGLFGEELMRFTTVEERMNHMDERYEEFIVRMRAYEAKTWIKARQIYYSLKQVMKAEIMEYWNSSKCPKKASYFADLVYQTTVNPNHIKDIYKSYMPKDFEKIDMGETR